MPEDRHRVTPVAICSCADIMKAILRVTNVYVLFVVQKVMRLLKLVHEKKEFEVWPYTEYESN